MSQPLSPPSSTETDAGVLPTDLYITHALCGRCGEATPLAEPSGTTEQLCTICHGIAAIIVGEQSTGNTTAYHALHRPTCLFALVQEDVPYDILGMSLFLPCGCPGS